MHVLPLPFGLALAVLPRREAERIREPKRPVLLHHEPPARDRLSPQFRYADLHQVR